MATFQLVEGTPGQGKSLYTAQLARKLLERNLRYHAKGGALRYVYSNIKFSPDFEEFWAPGIKYWSTLEDIVKLRHVDILWDEIATELDARNWPMLSDEVKRFLSQYRKRGLEIYANTQDFSMVDMRARLMIKEVIQLNKLIGSGDPSATKPKIKYIWGLVMMRSIINYRKLGADDKREYGLPSFFWISRKDCEIYDTEQDIQMGEPAPLKHIIQKCIHTDDPEHECDYRKVVHR